MTNNTTPQAAARSAAQLALWLVLLAAAGTFAMTMGTRQTMGLFLSALNTSTGLGIGSISLAFAFGQLWWGLTQPFAGAVADRIGTGRVILLGVMLVALGTFITPYMTTTAGLIAPTVAATTGLSQLDLCFLVIAIASGSTVLSHFNDSGFWLVGRFLNMDEKTTLKTWTVMETLLGAIGFALAAIGWWLL